jgi:hypothetical protein
VDKAGEQARTKAERALGAPLPATETEGAPAGRLASYEFRLLASRTAAVMTYGRWGGWSGCKDDVTKYEDRPAIMKALDLTEKAAAGLAGKVPPPTAKEISELQEELDEYSRLLDRAIGMFKRAAAVACRIEAWYEVDPDHPDAQALVVEWCGNLKGLTQKMLEVRDTANGEALKAAIAIPGNDLTDVEDILKKEREFTNLLKTVITEQNRLKGMGCSCE